MPARFHVFKADAEKNQPKEDEDCAGDCRVVHRPLVLLRAPEHGQQCANGGKEDDTATKTVQDDGRLPPDDRYCAEPTIPMRVVEGLMQLATTERTAGHQRRPACNGDAGNPK